jgi:hypothetical protein
MSEPKTIEQNSKRLPDSNEVKSDDGVSPSAGGRTESMRAAIRKFFDGMNREGRPVVQRDPKQDRTRPLLLLIGGIVGSVLLFVGVFSTPPTRPSPMERDRAEPNLGNRGLVSTDKAPSVTPLLNAQIESAETARDRLNATDIRNTSQREAASELSGDPDQARTAVPEALALTQNSLNQPNRPPRPVMVAAPEFGARESAPYLATPAPAPDSAFSSIRNVSVPAPAVPPSVGKSSIVYVRTPVATTGAENLSREMQTTRASLLSPGTRLIARLESAVSSALQAPVVASVEYSYEKNGDILVPAGAKVVGQLQQASASGLVSIVFHSLQMPDGRTEQIQAVAMDLRSEPIKGNVTGTNKGRRLLTRTLSGVGTVAAYAVGGSGGLGQTITGGTLLRDRIAGNIASAGEQELTNAAITQSVVVTVPAQTRIYVVLQKPAIEVQAPTAGAAAPSTAHPGWPTPTVQEIRELMELRQEINRMYRDSAASPLSATP